MNDQQVKNLVAFLAWSETSSGVGAKSPEQIKIAWQNIAMSVSDASGKLDLAALNLYVTWLKQWLPSEAPHGGAKPPENLTGGQL